MTAREFKTKRIELGLSQGALAKQLGLVKITVLRYEAGESPIPVTVALVMEAKRKQKPQRKTA